MKNKKSLNTDESKIDGLLTKVFEEIESRSLGNSEAGKAINFYDLDAMTQGLSPGNLYIIGGRPAMGKTSFVLNIAKNIGQFHNLPVCFFSLETSKKMLSYRLLSMDTGIESGRLRTGRLTQDEWPFLGEAINLYSKNPIYLIDKSTIQVSEIYQFCEEVKNNHKKNLGLIVIDFLQLLEDRTLGQNISREDELSKILNDLKNLSINLEVPVIITSQLNRELETRLNKRPMLIDIRDSEVIENLSLIHI